jgi:hypothetical protein
MFAFLHFNLPLIFRSGPFFSAPVDSLECRLTGKGAREIGNLFFSFIAPLSLGPSRRPILGSAPYKIQI